MSDRQQEAVWRAWAEGSRGYLTRLTSSVTALRESIDSCSPAGLEPQEKLASEVTSSAAALAAWLDASKAPRGLGRAEGELAAIAGVYRNAAVAYGSLDEGGSDQCAARFSACMKLLKQGADHVELFDELLRKRLATA